MLALVVALAACAPVEVHEGPPGWWAHTRGRLSPLPAHPAVVDDNALNAHGLVPGLRDPVGGDPWLPPPEGPLDELVNPISAAEVSWEIGAALTERLLEEEGWEDWGPGLLTALELFGDGETPGLCEPPEIIARFSEDGASYEARYMLPEWTHFLGDIEPWLFAIGGACEGALEEVGADAAVAAGDCTDIEEASFFPVGSECRACLDDTGDWSGCMDAGTCEDTGQARMWILEGEEAVWYDAYYAVLWGCAPIWLEPAILLGHNQPDGSVPEPFDHEAWSWFCFYTLNEEQGVPWAYCNSGPGGPVDVTVGEGTIGYVRHLHEVGDDGGHGWEGRGVYAAYAQLLDPVARVDRYWGWNPGIGAVSSPLVFEDTDGDGEVGPGDVGFGHGFGYNWGLNPRDTRPDGESQAQDFVAMEILKSSTTLSGIWVSGANRNRCPDDGWVDVGDGTFHCPEPAPPEAGWLSDGEVGWTTDGTALYYPYALTTIASTGLPDPSIPGGHVIHLASGPALSHPTWEACTHPHTFAPDTMVFPPAAGVFDAPGPMVGQTYRFGKDDSGIRAVMNTNMRRGYCPGGSEGWSGPDSLPW